MKLLRTLLLVLCLALLLSSCGGISGEDAIKRAKQNASGIQSGPRMYSTSSSREVEFWPNTPNSITQTYTTGGGYFLTPADSQGVITLTTSLSPYPLGSGWLVTFQSSWSNRSHRWQFHVGDDSKAEFMFEDGDKLPDLPS